MVAYENGVSETSLHDTEALDDTSVFFYYKLLFLIAAPVYAAGSSKA